MPKEFESKVIENLAELKGTLTSIKEDIHSMKQDIDINTKDLTEHKQMSATNKARFELEQETRKEKDKEHNERLTKVEVIPQYLNTSKKIIVWVGSIAAAIYAIGRLAGRW